MWQMPDLAAALRLLLRACRPSGVYAALSVNLRKYRYRFADVHSSDAQLMQQFSVKKARPILYQCYLCLARTCQEAPKYPVPCLANMFLPCMHTQWHMAGWEGH